MPTLRSLVRFVAAPAAAATLFMLVDESDAKAQVYVVRRVQQPESVGLNLGIDLEGASNVTPPQGSGYGNGGGGFKLRVGAEIRRPWLRFIPEGGFAYTHLFQTDPYGNNVGWNMERLFVGGRIGFGEVIVPIVYGHVGYGWRATNQDTISSAPGIPGANGVSADIGIGIDFHLIRNFGFGFHAEYVTVQTAPAVPDWVAGGAHIDVRF